MNAERATRASWKNLPMPERRQRLEVRRSYSADEYARISRGLVPEQMEDKWFILLEDETLSLFRSWTGYCVYAVRLVEQDGRYAIAEAWVNRDPEQYLATDDRYDSKMLLYLIDELLLGCDAEFPEREDLDQDENALFRWSQAGRGRPTSDDGGA